MLQFCNEIHLLHALIPISVLSLKISYDGDKPFLRQQLSVRNYKTSVKTSPKGCSCSKSTHCIQSEEHFI